MQKFIMISKRVTGWLEYYFSATGTLIGYHVKAEMSNDALIKVAELLPASPAALKLMAAKTGAQVLLVELDFTFDHWYDLFDVQRNRDRACQIWKKDLTEKDRLRCFVALEGYKRYCKKNPWYNPQYPDTWLRNRQFETEWDKL